MSSIQWLRRGILYWCFMNSSLCSSFLRSFMRKMVQSAVQEVCGRYRIQNSFQTRLWVAADLSSPAHSSIWTAAVSWENECDVGMYAFSFPCVVVYLVGLPSYPHCRKDILRHTWEDHPDFADLQNGYEQVWTDTRQRKHVILTAFLLPNCCSERYGALRQRQSERGGRHDESCSTAGLRPLLSSFPFY